MKLEIGNYYSVLFADGSVVSFRFIGGNPPTVDIAGKEVNLVALLTKPVLAYWVNDAGNPFVV